jgi:hypothetical protein
MAAFWELDSVQQHARQAAQMAGELIQHQVLEELHSITTEVESPIEAIFLVWWDVLRRVLPKMIKLRAWAQFGFAPINGRNYRADIVIWPTDMNNNDLLTEYKAVIVELDGHDFHERTKEQVIARNQRDRDFQEKGYIVLHFSGSELCRDPLKVLTDVISAASKEYNRAIDVIKANQSKA